MSGRMVRTVILTVLLAVGFSPMVEAQGRIEITPFVGYTLSEGVRFDSQVVAGVLIDELVPRSGLSYGVQGDYTADNWSIGFQYSDQLSELEVGSPTVGVSDRVVTDMNVRNYHGMFTYIFGRGGEPIRPYIFLGLGASNYSFQPIMGNDVMGETRFSSTWGGGVKFYTSEHIGFRASGRWTPTYINSDPGGIWCSPYWPGACWVVGDPNYSHQFEMSGGVILSF